MLTSDSEFYYWPRGLDVSLTPEFKTHEFTCKCNNGCGPQRISKALLIKLVSVRHDLQQPLMIHSGFRCEKHQQELKEEGYETAKGVSQHELGNAADVSATGMNELLQLLNRNFLAVGVAKTFIHVDTRSDKLRRWAYQSL